MVLRAWAEDIHAPVGDVRSALSRVRENPATLDDREWVALLGAAGAELDELAGLADSARARVTDPTAFTFVVNRNLDTGVAAALESAPTLEELVAEARALGATEICMQGPLPATAPADGYLRLVERIVGAAPDLHLHAFRPTEIHDGAARLGLSLHDHLAALRAAGLGSVPGTAAQVLDDEVRSALAGGAPVPSASTWEASIIAAHRVGLTSTATLLYGHLETPAQQVAHLRLLNRIQDETGGFTELILMPMLPQNAPPPVAALAATGPSERETRAVHAVARLITLGRFDHLQVAWTKLDRALVTDLLNGGADDIGGLLLDGTLRPDAGAEAGLVLGADDLLDVATRIGRSPRQRTTRYGEPTAAQRYPIPQVQP
ncbi:FO synthase [Gordonia sp. ABSL1-1]|uniref:FO synthase n=1 Tax=Gordonia sp. ABSL1-1 TaxID=3053923 RepID=UPI002572DF86|nr:FO synthase [Gordonia sp. ABSL1-1]MDL9935681.1 FO synthase [Gordonia sp. ABSL1-1]